MLGRPGQGRRRSPEEEERSPPVFFGCFHPTKDLERGCGILAFLTILLYFALGIAAILGAAVLFLLLVPIKYRCEGGFEAGWRFGFRARCSPLITAGGYWEHGKDRPLQLRVAVAGIPFTLDPQKWGQEDAGEQEDDHKKDSPSPGFFLRSLDGKLMGMAGSLVVDLLKILSPRHLELEGKIGFDEPHLTGWLAALLHFTADHFRFCRFNLEPAWDGEHCEIRFLVDGTLWAGLILARIARFMLTRRVLRFLLELRRARAPRSRRLSFPGRGYSHL